MSCLLSQGINSLLGIYTLKVISGVLNWSKSAASMTYSIFVYDELYNRIINLDLLVLKFARFCPSNYFWQKILNIIRYRACN